MGAQDPKVSCNDLNHRGTEAQREKDFRPDFEAQRRDERRGGRTGNLNHEDAKDTERKEFCSNLSLLSPCPLILRGLKNLLCVAMPLWFNSVSV